MILLGCKYPSTFPIFFAKAILKVNLKGNCESWRPFGLKSFCGVWGLTWEIFLHRTEGNVCLLSDSNVGLSGSLKPTSGYDYYEMTERSINCRDMFVCNNQKCVNQSRVCDGKNDCGDRSDENVCTAQNLDYAIRLAGSNSSNEGRVEVKGMWYQKIKCFCIERNICF